MRRVSEGCAVNPFTPLEDKFIMNSAAVDSRFLNSRFALCSAAVGLLALNLGGCASTGNAAAAPAATAMKAEPAVLQVEPRVVQRDLGAADRPPARNAP
jgi:hypothetical protein